MNNELADKPDSELIARYCESRDEAAFRSIVERHATMVSSVCAAVLGNRIDVEDAFQSTFFILARKASTIKNRASVAAWLHRVSLRCALAIRKRESRVRVTQMPQEDVVLVNQELDKISTRETVSLLHEELDRLPPSYRTAVILCYLEGVEQSAAAQQLGIQEPALRKRLERARTILRNRLGVVSVSTVALACIFRCSLQLGAPLASPHLMGATVSAVMSTESAWANGLVAFHGKQASLALAQGILKSISAVCAFRLSILCLLAAVALSATTVSLDCARAAQEPFVLQDDPLTRGAGVLSNSKATLLAVGRAPAAQRIATLGRKEISPEPPEIAVPFSGGPVDLWTDPSWTGAGASRSKAGN